MDEARYPLEYVLLTPVRPSSVLASLSERTDLNEYYVYVGGYGSQDIYQIHLGEFEAGLN